MWMGLGYGLAQTLGAGKEQKREGRQKKKAEGEAEKPPQVLGTTMGLSACGHFSGSDGDFQSLIADRLVLTRPTRAATVVPTNDRTQIYWRLC